MILPGTPGCTWQCQLSGAAWGWKKVCSGISPRDVLRRGIFSGKSNKGVNPDHRAPGSAYQYHICSLRSKLWGNGWTLGLSHVQHFTGFFFLFKNSTCSNSDRKFKYAAGEKYMPYIICLV